MSRISRLLKQHYCLKAEHLQDENVRSKRVERMYLELDKVEKERVEIFHDACARMEKLNNRIDELIVEYFYLIKFDDCRKLMNEFN